MPPEIVASPQRIELCGVAVEVGTDHAEFARYLAHHFAGEPAPADTRAADVLVHVRWREGWPEPLRPSTVFPGWEVDMLIDRHIHVGPNRVMWLRIDDAAPIAVACEQRGRSRRFELAFHFSLGGRGWRERIKRALYWRRLPALRRNRLSTLTYYAVYYPVWWHLESQGAGHPLHAAGVAIGGRALVLAGLPGAGKSTLATALLGTPGAVLLADNIVLHDGREVRGCFEPLLLDARTRRSVGVSHALEALGRQHVFARDAYRIPHETRSVPLAGAVVLTRGRETRVTPISSAKCAHTLLAINEIAKEVRRYHVLAAVLGMIEPEASAHVQERAVRLERLLAGASCHVLQVREGAPEEAVGVLRELAAPARQVAR